MPSIMITSANRGLGLEFARQYAADGRRVLAACRNPETAAELRDLARAGRMTIFPMDVTDPHSIQRARADFAGEAIDVLINSAGLFGKENQKAGNIDYQSWKEVLDVNTLGPLRVTEAFFDQIARSERKLVVTITSGMGSLSDTTSGGAIPLSQLEGRGEHGDAQRGDRSCSPRHRLCPRQSWLGQDRHGWDRRTTGAVRKCGRSQTPDCHTRIGSIRQVLQLRRSRISLVNRLNHPNPI